jgi:DNA polymerase
MEGVKVLSEIKTLSIDIETYSDIDLSKCGVYKYILSLPMRFTGFEMKRRLH